ncbi:MAG: 4-hydroxy-3-methylbut-2-enyl diphosphate reductase [Dehalococcoidia bacterium]|jgi:4-hydroxy-3-methylbut-2-enyl diphosphate reductase|nr:4-hydroxy-3-methylbut-2-enyl diphosphate reductase [Dehalococcoidia bacterium]
MEVVLSAPRGFCAGVVRAVDVVELCLERFGSPIYVRREIVHNPHVVSDLKSKGAIFVEELEELPEGQRVVFSAHGVSPAVWKHSRDRGLQVVDATCPLVTKVHLEALKYAKEGYSVLLIGHSGHDEVIGTMGEAPEASILVEDIVRARTVQVLDPERVVVLTQTTLSVDDTSEIMRVLKERFPDLISRNDICYATTNRQAAVKAITKEVDLVLVIGAQNSSNCNRLREVAEVDGVPAYLVNGPADIQREWLDGVERVGITSGASTPERLVEEVVASLGPASVRNVEIVEEDVTFLLPRALR